MIQQKIADMKCKLDASQLLTLRAAWAKHRRRQYAHHTDDPTGMVEISVI